MAGNPRPEKFNNRPSSRDETPGNDEEVFISRITIRDDQFQLCVWNKESQKDDFVTVNFGDIYEAYKEEAVAILRVIYHSELTAYPVIQDE
jgi:hypothetical protein